MPTRLSSFPPCCLACNCARLAKRNAAPSALFAIRVVDAETGRGVPLVELETVNHLRFYTDSNGTVAFREPGLMGRQIFFHVRSHGYEYPKDELRLSRCAAENHAWHRGGAEA